VTGENSFQDGASARRCPTGTCTQNEARKFVQLRAKPVQSDTPLRNMDFHSLGLIEALHALFSRSRTSTFVFGVSMSISMQQLADDLEKLRKEFRHYKTEVQAMVNKLAERIEKLESQQKK
jgi:hypothetical protein